MSILIFSVSTFFLIALSIETVSRCHCEGVKRPKPFGLEPFGSERLDLSSSTGLKAEGLTAERQSHNALEIKRLPRSLRSLAMTKKDCDTVSLVTGIGVPKRNGE
jgi:hypothetical protein